MYFNFVSMLSLDCAQLVSLERPVLSCAILPSAYNAGYYGREILNISRHGFQAGHMIFNTIFQVRRKKNFPVLSLPSELCSCFCIGGFGSRLLNRNRLLADPNLDLGLDRVGDQRRRIYYVVRRKEGIQLVGYLGKQQEAHSEMDGCLLVLNS